MSTKKLTLAARRAWQTRYLRAGLPPFQATEAAGLLEKKSPQREEIIRFLLDYHPESPLQLLSLPASRFELEREVARIRPDARFTCLERDRKFLRVAFTTFSAQSPGGKLKKAEKLIGHRYAYRNRKVHLLNIRAGELDQVEIDRPITAVWYDGMGLMSTADFREFLGGLEAKITDEHPVPAVFTLLQGRDDAKFYKNTPGNNSSRRVRKLLSLLGNAGLDFDLRTFWAYGSDSGGPVRMLNVCGLLTRKVNRTKLGKVPYAWTSITHNELETLRSTVTEHALAAILGLTLSTVRNWDEDHAPDSVVQAELTRLIVTCQALASRGDDEDPPFHADWQKRVASRSLGAGGVRFTRP